VSKNKNTRPAYITFLGVTGAGKSTIANELTKALDGKGYSVASYAEFRRLGRISRHILPVVYTLGSKKSLKEFAYFVRLFVKLLPLNSWELAGFVHGVKTHAVRDFVMRTVPADVYIFEEDTMTPFLNIDAKKLKRLNLSKFLTRLVLFFGRCRPAVVSVEASVDVAIERAHQEAHRRVFPTPFYENVLVNQEKFMDLLKESYPELVQITVSGTAPLQDNMDIILSALKEKSVI